MFLVKRIINYFTWVMFFVLLVTGGIIYATDRTYPGDKLYPFKLKFEVFVLATSKILNKQVDFSIDLVSKRSKEVAKILTPKNSGEILSRLDIQVESTAISISQISNPVEKKKAAQKYIAKLTEVSTTLNEQHQVFVNTSQPSNNNQPQSYVNPTESSSNSEKATDPTIQPTVKVVSGSNDILYPTPVTEPTYQSDTEVVEEPDTTEIIEDIESTQEIVQDTIDEMTEIANEDGTEEKGRGNSEDRRRDSDKKNNGNDDANSNN